MKFHKKNDKTEHLKTVAKADLNKKRTHIITVLN